MQIQSTSRHSMITDYFSSIEDPRLNRRKRHKLGDIFFMALCAITCGADTWTGIALFAKTKQKWFTQVLELTDETPSHDTFARVFSLIKPEQFNVCFSRWANDLSTTQDRKIIAIDGKCLRSSLDRAAKKSAIYMVSAYEVEGQLVLGQQKVDEKSNEITAIPKLLNNIDISGSVITLDAMGCQKDIAQQIVDKEADYFLSLKGNQGNLHEFVKLFFESENTSPVTGHTSYDAEHGRYETRKVRATDDIDWLKKVHPEWAKLTSIIAVTSEREVREKISEETRYFISSLAVDDVKYLGHVARSHWAIENNLHWVLDNSFNEDHQRMRIGYSDANMAVMRHITLNMLKLDKTNKAGIKNKRLLAGWDEDYLLRIITGHIRNTKDSD
ncbi:MAG: ISAs1 family transposase [Burkholderiales bacterium]|nr:MAG: ISAs1 family transposase [Burkholderiales bacterium]